jgi:repressor LexA
MSEHVTPTVRQLRVMHLIAGGRERDGFPPTIRELMTKLKIASSHGVWCHLDTLREKGLVTWQPAKGRTLDVTPAGQQWLGKTPEQHAAELEREKKAERRLRAMRRGAA